MSTTLETKAYQMDPQQRQKIALQAVSNSNITNLAAANQVSRRFV